LNVSLLTPWAALAGLAAVVPLAAWLVASRRAARVRALLGLAPAGVGARAVVPLSLGLAVGLLALAAAQPVLAHRHPTTQLHDADVFVVIDTTRSMLAARSAGGPSRFERATAISQRFARSLPAAALGLASMTDRVLPHLFPTTNRHDFLVTLREAIAIEAPPPATPGVGHLHQRSTSLGVLAALGEGRLFEPSARRRIAVVLTDGESRPFDADPIRRALARERIALVLVHVWHLEERIWRGGGSTEAYRADPGSGLAVSRLATDVGGAAFEEDELNGAVAEIRRLAHTGRAERRTEARSVRRLAAPVAALALIPLGIVLWRRNLA